MNASEKEIVFTSGATESDDLAILGVAHMYRQKGNHVITGKTEHRAVLDTCRSLEKEGFEVSYLDTDAWGQVSPEQVRAAITDKTILVTLMLANNEVGTIHRIAEIGAVCREKGVVVSHRCGAGVRQDSLRRRGDAGRSRLGHRTQALWPQGRRGPLREEARALA